MPRSDVEVRIATGGRFDERRVPDRVSGRRKPEERELAPGRRLDERDPEGRLTFSRNRAPPRGVGSTPRGTPPGRYAGGEPPPPVAGRATSRSRLRDPRGTARGWGTPRADRRSQRRSRRSRSGRRGAPTRPRATW